MFSVDSSTADYIKTSAWILVRSMRLVPFSAQYLILGLASPHTTKKAPKGQFDLWELCNAVTVSAAANNGYYMIEL